MNRKRQLCLWSIPKRVEVALRQAQQEKFEGLKRKIAIKESGHKMGYLRLVSQIPKK